MSRFHTGGKGWRQEEQKINSMVIYMYKYKFFLLGNTQQTPPFPEDLQRITGRGRNILFSVIPLVSCLCLCK